MKSINHTLTGLASSLFLNVGLTQVAQKLDPISQTGNYDSVAGQAAPATYPCNFSPATYPCNFTPKQGA